MNWVKGALLQILWLLPKLKFPERLVLFLSRSVLVVRKYLTLDCLVLESLNFLPALLRPYKIQMHKQRVQ